MVLTLNGWTIHCARAWIKIPNQTKKIRFKAPYTDTGCPISYRKYILQITQPTKYKYTKLQNRFAVISGAPSMVPIYCMPKKSCPSLCSESQNRHRQDFLDIQYNGSPASHGYTILDWSPVIHCYLLHQFMGLECVSHPAVPPSRWREWRDERMEGNATDLATEQKTLSVFWDRAATWEITYVSPSMWVWSRQRDR